MSKYRIIKHNGEFRIQQKFWFFWVYDISEYPIEFHTIKEAERAIKEWIGWDSENGTVVREYEE